MRKKARTQTLADGVDAVRKAGPYVPLDGEPGGRQWLARQMQGVHGNKIVGFTVHEQNGRPGFDFPRRSGPASKPE